VTGLRAGGADITDHGDLPGRAPPAEPQQRNPHDLDRVLGVLSDASAGIGRVLADGATPVEIGGECTPAIALVTAVTRHDGEAPALVYVDGGVDQRTPEALAAIGSPRFRVDAVRADPAG
jgi:arginase